MVAVVVVKSAEVECSGVRVVVIVVIIVIVVAAVAAVAAVVVLCSCS